MGNRLSMTTDNGGNGNYQYSGSEGSHGLMTSMPHLRFMRWNFMDELQATSQQVVNTGAPETTYYVYNSQGQRIRKVTERQAVEGHEPIRMKERIYLGGFEIYRTYR